MNRTARAFATLVAISLIGITLANGYACHGHLQNAIRYHEGSGGRKTAEADKQRLQQQLNAQYLIDLDGVGRADGRGRVM